MNGFLLWENHAAGPIDRFGPHAFLVACVAARLGLDRFQLLRSARISGRSCNGNGGVLRELGRDPLWNAAPNLVAVLDSDKLHVLLGCEARSRVADTDYGSWSARVEQQIRKRLDPRDTAPLTIHFLDQNLESLLQVLGDTSTRKNVLERDSLLLRAAADPALIRRAQEAMPSWAGLVDIATRWLAPGATPEPARR